MPEYLILLDPSTERFYRRVADAAGVRTEQVLSDALFRLAGELSFEALAAQKKKGRCKILTGKTVNLQTEHCISGTAFAILYKMYLHTYL